MVGIQNYGSFILTILVFQAVPGAGTITILNATARDGRWAGFASIAGTLLGDCLYMIAAAAGLATVIKAQPLLFDGLQWFGAAYLSWMGVTLLRSKFEVEGRNVSLRWSPWRYGRRALAVSLTNPKVILFFVAFFPLFMTPTATHATLLVMMLHVLGLSAFYQGLLVCLGNSIAVRLRSLPSARRIATRVAGFALIALSVKMAAFS